jgi:hypothetical protein
MKISKLEKRIRNIVEASGEKDVAFSKDDIIHLLEEIDFLRAQIKKTNLLEVKEENQERF